MRSAAIAVPPGLGCQHCSTVYATRIGRSPVFDELNIVAHHGGHVARR
jgi:hypothetical protein